MPALICNLPIAQKMSTLESKYTFQFRKWEKNNIEIDLNPTENDIDQAYELYLIMMKDKFLPVEK